MAAIPETGGDRSGGDPGGGPLTVAGARIAPGERRTLELPIADLSTHAPMTIPVQVVHGADPAGGPRLLLCAALHGDEINGVEIIRRVLLDVAPERLAGAVDAVPVVNVFGFISLSRYLPDRRDLNRSFPGSARGSLASRVAHAFLGEIVGACSHVLDLHTGAIHRTNYPQVRGDLDDPATFALAEAFAPPVIVDAGVREGSLRGAVAGRGVPILVYEGGEALRFDEEAIVEGCAGVRRVMAALGMIPGADAPAPRRRPIVARSSTWVRAEASGVLRAVVDMGERVREGQCLGLVADPFGENEVEVRAPADGVLIGGTRLPLVHEGDALFHVARVEGAKADAEELDTQDPEAPPPPSAEA